MELNEYQKENDQMMKKFLIGYFGAGVAAIFFWGGIMTDGYPHESWKLVMIRVAFVIMAVLYIYGAVHIMKMLRNVGQIMNNEKRSIDRSIIGITVLVWVQGIIAGFFSILFVSNT